MESPGKKAMQPPPRKAKVTTSLRNTQNEQLTKLQYKHQVDVELLEDIRNFTKQRASIEKEYGQALLKLSANYLQRKFLTLGTDRKDPSGNKLVYQVWKTLLDETEKIAKARLAAVEVYQQQISESAKTVRSSKLHVAKKCFDNMRKMHEEIQTCVTEIDKTKKLYFEEEHMAHGAREKAQDADEKLKRKRGRIFQSIAALQKNSAKFSSRKEACDIQSTKARNDYILALVAANAHQKRFYDVDLPDIIQTLDCGFCENVREYIVLMARTELLTCAACQASYSKVQLEAETITSQFTLDCYLRDNPVLGSMVQYNFDPCDEDPLRIISLEHNAALCLSKEARKWASCITKETRTLRDCSKEIVKLQGRIAAGDRVENTPGDGSVDLETKLDELKQLIRRAETSKSKAEARIETLREGGVNVEEWLKSNSDGDSLCLHDDLSRKGSTSSRSSSHFSTHSEVVGEAGSEANDSFYDSDFNDGSSETSGAVTGAAPGARFSSVSDSDSVVEPQPVVDVVAAVTEAWDTSAALESEEPSTEDSPFPDQEAPLPISSKETEYGAPSGIRCVALFNYEAANSDELNFVEQEELEIIDEGDGDGWIKARNYKGEEGFIPQNYVEVLDIPLTDPSAKSGMVSFSSVDYTMPEEDEISGLTVKETSDEVVEGPPSPPTTLDIQERSVAPVVIAGAYYCRALYDYEATCDEELTFLEGQLIEVVRKVVHDVDDGWWEGIINGQLGIFPSLVVEELKIDGEPQTPLDVMSPPGSAPPPLYTPPKPQFLVPPAQVILIQPTPETEEVEEGEGTKEQKVEIRLLQENDFQLELTGSQQAQYQTQFSDSESSEQEASAANADGSYAPLVSSPDSPTHSSELTGDQKASTDAAENEEITLDLTMQSTVTIALECASDDDAPPEDDEDTIPTPAPEQAEAEESDKKPDNPTEEPVQEPDKDPELEPEPEPIPEPIEEVIVKDETKLVEDETDQVLQGLEESEGSITEVTVLENVRRQTSGQDLSGSDEIADELGASDGEQVIDGTEEPAKQLDSPQNADAQAEALDNNDGVKSDEVNNVEFEAHELDFANVDFGTDFPNLATVEFAKVEFAKVEVSSVTKPEEKPKEGNDGATLGASVGESGISKSGSHYDLL